DPQLVPERLGQTATQDDADVLDGVVRVDVEISAGVDREVERGVAAQLVQHVVEEGQAGRDLRLARAVDHERGVDGRLLGGALLGGTSRRSGHRLSLSAWRKRSFSSGVPMVTR